MAAAEAVCAGDGLESDDILDLLAHLVHKSLVRVEEKDGEACFSWLERIRHHVCKKLLESGEGDWMCRRHLDYFLEFAERGDRESREPRSLGWKRRMDAEHNNLRAALEYAFDTEGAIDAVVHLTRAVDGSMVSGQRVPGRRAIIGLRKPWLIPLPCLPRCFVPGSSSIPPFLMIIAQGKNSIPDLLAIFDGLGEAFWVEHTYLLMWLGFKLCYQPYERENGTRYVQEAI
ncbi:MAG: hypothetical protein R6X18_04565 [Chloroflexota bacterium]